MPVHALVLALPEVPCSFCAAAHPCSALLPPLLQVLLKFLEFFGAFDWDRYCLSLHGPVPLEKLPSMEPEVGPGTPRIHPPHPLISALGATEETVLYCCGGLFVQRQHCQ